MEPQTSIVKHIETYVDSSTSPAHQNSSVNAISALLKNDIISMEYLVREMGLYLTTTDHILRARGMLLLAEVLGHLQVKPLSGATIHTLAGFFTERLTDWRALRGALLGCLALVRRKSGAGMVSGADAKALAKSYLENLQVQSLGQHDRKLCFELLECLLERYVKSFSDLGDHLVYGFCEAIEGEKDPECLMHAFHIVELLGRTFSDPTGPVASLAEDIFDIIGRYFPIHFTHPKNEDVDICRDDLSRALMMAFSASPFFEPFAIPLLLEKLSSTLPLAKVDSLKYLAYCIGEFGPERTGKHAAAVWSSVKATIYDLPMENDSSLALDLSYSMSFPGNEITKEALLLIQKIVSNQNNGLLRLILQDEDITSLINSVASSGIMYDSLRHDAHKLHVVGCLLSVLAKASTSSCNTVFETVFLRLVNSLGISPNVASDETIAKDSTVPNQRLNLSALYLGLQVLDACRESAANSVRVTLDANITDDKWCRMLASSSSSLMKIFASELATCTDERYHDSDFSLIVKGLQLLATFPGGALPVSTPTFESILLTLVSIITDKFNMTSLWKVSLNALVEIGKFINEYRYPVKLLSYMSKVVERIMLLLLVDDSRMPYSLVLEALSDIGASGQSFMSRIVKGVQEAISIKFAKIYVDGDQKVAAELVQLLECYSSKLLPWYQKSEDSEGAPLQLAIDIWDQIEAAMKIDFCVKGEDLLNATKRAVRIAVAMCSKEDQCIIAEKAFRVISSNKAFSPKLVSSQLEGLKITQGIKSFEWRDEWLISLFATAIIAFRPETQIPDLKAVIDLLLTAFLKGHVTSAQALGSIANKMPQKDNQFQYSSYLSVDDIMEMILRLSLGSCRDYFLSCGSEMPNKHGLCLNLADCALFLPDCISGLAWIGKGLLMRGHEKLKDITVTLLKFLGSSSEIKSLLEQNNLLEDEDLIKSLMKSAADAFHVFMSDFDDCLNRTFHATVRPLYKQRFFSFVMPILLSAAKGSHSPVARSMLYRAIGYVICDTPLVAVLAESKKLLPMLVDIISVLSLDILNKDLIYSLLLVLSGLLMDNHGKDIATENAHVIINCLTKLLSYPHKMVVRETAVQCLVAMSGMPHARIYPMRTQVLKALSEVLDDSKRSVRQEAVRCRQAWASIV